MRVLSVKEKSVIRDANGSFNLKPVMARRFKNNRYTHINVSGVIHSASIASGIVWIDGESNGKRMDVPARLMTGN